MFGFSIRLRLTVSLLMAAVSLLSFYEPLFAQAGSVVDPQFDRAANGDILIEPLFIEAQIDAGETAEFAINVCNDGDEDFRFRISPECVLFSPLSRPRRLPANTGPERPAPPKGDVPGLALGHIFLAAPIPKGLAFDGRVIWSVSEDANFSYLTSYDPLSGAAVDVVRMWIFSDGIAYRDGRLALLRRSQLAYCDLQGNLMQYFSVRTNTTRDFCFGEDRILLVSDRSLYVVSSATGHILADIDVMAALTLPNCSIQAVEYVPEHRPAPLWLLMKGDLHANLTFAVQCSLSADNHLFQVQDYWLENPCGNGLTHDGNHLWIAGADSSHRLHQIEDGVAESFWLTVDPSSAVIPPGTDQDLFVQLDARQLERGEYIAALHLQSLDNPSEDLALMVYLTVADPRSVNPKPDATIPQTCRIESVSPNPFNRETTVFFSQTAAGVAALKAYDLQGRQVATLLEGMLPAGHQRAVWQPEGLAAGEYLLRLETGGAAVVKKAMYLP